MGYIIVLLLLAIIPAVVASSKGRSAAGFYFFGLFFFLPALIVALCVEDRKEVAQRATMYQDMNSLKKDVADLSNSTSALLKPAVLPAKPEEKPDSPLLRRAFLSLEDGDWEKADEILEQLLNMEPENSKAYIGKLCVQLKLHHEEEIINYEHPIVNLPNYKRALQFADAKYKKTLELYALTDEQARDGIGEKEATYQYLITKINDVKARQRANEFEELISEIKQFGDYKDSLQLLHDLTTPVVIDDSIICPCCSTNQRSNRILCFRCGLKFNRELE